jgi:hypothetical protein
MKKREGFFTGLVLGTMLGCLIGFVIGESKSSSTESQDITLVELPMQNTVSSTAESYTSLPTKLITQTTTPTLSPTFTNTPLPSLLNIPYTSCGEHIAYSANAEVIKIPIVENDQIIEYASYVRITYKIRNTYTNTPIYGFEVRPSPGYDNPDSYPDTVFNSNSPFQPNEEVILKSEHLFVPDGWNSKEHPNAFWNFPENIRFHPQPYERTIGGYTVTFQIVEKFGSIDRNKEEVRCDGAIKVH